MLSIVRIFCLLAGLWVGSSVADEKASKPPAPKVPPVSKSPIAPKADIDFWLGNRYEFIGVGGNKDSIQNTMIDFGGEIGFNIFRAFSLNVQPYVSFIPNKEEVIDQVNLDMTARLFFAAYRVQLLTAEEFYFTDIMGYRWVIPPMENGRHKFGTTGIIGVGKNTLFEDKYNRFKVITQIYIESPSGGNPFFEFQYDTSLKNVKNNFVLKATFGFWGKDIYKRFMSLASGDKKEKNGEKKK